MIILSLYWVTEKCRGSSSNDLGVFLRLNGFTVATYLLPLGGNLMQSLSNEDMNNDKGKFAWNTVLLLNKITAFLLFRELKDLG